MFEKEVQNREERKINLLLSQAQLPKTGEQPYQRQHIQIPQGIDRKTVLKGERKFILVWRSGHRENILGNLNKLYCHTYIWQ